MPRDLPLLAVSPKEAARILRIADERVYRLIYSGQLRAYRSSERRMLVPLRAIEDYMARRCEEGVWS